MARAFELEPEGSLDTGPRYCCGNIKPSVWGSARLEGAPSAAIRALDRRPRCQARREFRSDRRQMPPTVTLRGTILPAARSHRPRSSATRRRRRYLRCATRSSWTTHVLPKSSAVGPTASTSSAYHGDDRSKLGDDDRGLRCRELGTIR